MIEETNGVATAASESANFENIKDDPLEAVVALHEEAVVVDKRRVKGETVCVATVIVEHEQQLEISLTREVINVERVRINKIGR